MLSLRDLIPAWRRLASRRVLQASRLLNVVGDAPWLGSLLARLARGPASVPVLLRHPDKFNARKAEVDSTACMHYPLSKGTETTGILCNRIVRTGTNSKRSLPKTTWNPSVLVKPVDKFQLSALDLSRLLAPGPRTRTRPAGGRRTA